MLRLKVCRAAAVPALVVAHPVLGTTLLRAPKACLAPSPPNLKVALGHKVVGDAPKVGHGLKAGLGLKVGHGLRGHAQAVSVQHLA